MGAPRNISPDELSQSSAKTLFFRLKIMKFKEYQDDRESYRFLKLVPVNPTDTLYLDERLEVEGLFFRLLRISGGGRHPGWVVRGDYQPMNLEQLAEIVKRPIHEFLEPLQRLMLTKRLALKEASPDEEDVERAAEKELKHDANDIVQLWNMHASKLAKVKRVSKQLAEEVSERLTEQPDLQYWEQVFVKMNATPFLTGAGKKKWRASLHWVMRDASNSHRVIQGYYDEQEPREEDTSEDIKGW